MGLNDNVVFLAHMNNDAWVDSAEVGTPVTSGDPSFNSSNKILGSHAGDFDGDDKVTYGAHTEHNAMGAWSAGAWIRPTTMAATMAIMSKGRLAPALGWMFYVYADGKLALGRLGGWELGWAGKISINTWSCVVVTKSAGGASSVYKMYHNGDLNPASATQSETADTVNLDVAGDSASVLAKFIGQIDEAVIWQQELTQADVTAFYNGGAGVELPVATATPPPINHASPMGIHLPMEIK